LICFNCDGIGHNKCPHKKKKMNEEDDSNRKKKHVKAKEQKRKSSRKFSAPKKIAPHQTKMKSVKVRQKDLYSWK